MTTGRLRGSVMPSSPVLPGEGARGLADLLGARVHIDVVVPRTNIAGKMRLLGRREHSEARAAARASLAARGIAITLHELAITTTNDEWNCELIAHTLAVAIRDPRDLTQPLDVVEEWMECDDDQLAALYQTYKDLGEKLDPLAATEISPTVWSAIEEAAKKKDVAALISFGSQSLSLFIATSAEPPAS